MQLTAAPRQLPAHLRQAALQQLLTSQLRRALRLLPRQLLQHCLRRPRTARSILQLRAQALSRQLLQLPQRHPRAILPRQARLMRSHRADARAGAPADVCYASIFTLARNAKATNGFRCRTSNAVGLAAGDNVATLRSIPPWSPSLTETAAASGEKSAAPLTTPQTSLLSSMPPRLPRHLPLLPPVHSLHTARRLRQLLILSLSLAAHRLPLLMALLALLLRKNRPRQSPLAVRRPSIA